MKALISGAELRCTCGSKNAQLFVDAANAVFFEGEPAATEADFDLLPKVEPFGKCGALQGAPCAPVALMPWLGPTWAVKIDGLLVLTDEFTRPCVNGGIIRPVAAGQGVVDIVQSQEPGIQLPNNNDEENTEEPVHGPKVVRLVFDDALFGPAAGAAVVLRFEDGSSIAATADGRGRVTFKTEHTMVWAVAETAHGKHETFAFLCIPKANTRSGLWQRLVNLGYVSSGGRRPSADPPSDEAFVMAVQEFQADHGIDVTGEVDAETVARIRIAHDNDNRAWSSRNWSPPPRPDCDDRQCKGSAT